MTQRHIKKVYYSGYGDLTPKVFDKSIIQETSFQLKQVTTTISHLQRESLTTEELNPEKKTKQEIHVNYFYIDSSANPKY